MPAQFIRKQGEHRKMKFTAKNEKCYYVINLKDFIDIDKLNREKTWRFKGMAKVFNDVDNDVWLTVRDALCKERAQLQHDIENNHKLYSFLISKPTRQNVVRRLQEYGTGEADRPETVEAMLKTQLTRWENARNSFWQFTRLDRLDKLIELWESGAKMKRVEVPAYMFKNNE